MLPLISAARSTRLLGPKLVPIPTPMPMSRPHRFIALVRYAATTATATAITPSHDISQPAQNPALNRRSPRRQPINDAKPFSDFLTDTFHRQHDYLRISLTERCNLRCVYCMPEEGVPLSPPKELLTTPEIIMLSSLFVSQGVTKIRLTGGEPTVRKDILPLMRQIGALRSHGLRELCLTTNGLVLHRKLEGMVEAGLTGVNLSLDTLDPWQFQIMTRRKGFDAVMKSIEKVLELNKHGAGIKLKINSVIMRGINDREIMPFVEMTREKNIEVRFIEYMPFDGNKWNEGKMFSYSEMLDLIKKEYPQLEKVDGHKNDTSKTYKIPGFVGSLGFITSMTHNFCGTCNRLRITSDGNLKVCLFGNAEVSLRDILRQSNNGEPIDESVFEIMKQVEMDRKQGLRDDSTQPGLAPNEQELLNVIGLAVKRKKAKHAGIGELEHMKNRPMILIDLERPKYDSCHDMLRPDSVTDRITRGSYLFNGISPLLTLSSRMHLQQQQLRRFSSTRRQRERQVDRNKLTHVSESGAAHMVSISDKTPSKRLAKAVCSVRFTDKTACRLIEENQIQKGDVLGVARVAGIMAAKKTADLIPLCHPIALSKVTVNLDVVQGPDDAGRVDIEAIVTCEGKTGVEMEALTAASTAALTIYDMCKAVDKRMAIEGLRVVLKEGGKSGRWIDGTHDGSPTLES
ncbi:molybdenum cofactor biosynthesis protein 1 B [Xylaria sp. FL1042]|nr:molybdenum cofactor biosynthesis protein 1 B [Xylaria sp. FL1042]